jgi:pimeloyl-ACP methyl ester carboxylesterase
MRSPHVCGKTIDCGHHMSEEAPDELAGILVDFFAP